MSYEDEGPVCQHCFHRVRRHGPDGCMVGWLVKDYKQPPCICPANDTEAAASQARYGEPVKALQTKA